MFECAICPRAQADLSSVNLGNRGYSEISGNSICAVTVNNFDAGGSWPEVGLNQSIRWMNRLENATLTPPPLWPDFANTTGQAAVASPATSTTFYAVGDDVLVQDKFSNVYNVPMRFPGPSYWSQGSAGGVRGGACMDNLPVKFWTDVEQREGSCLRGIPYLDAAACSRLSAYAYVGQSNIQARPAASADDASAHLSSMYALPSETNSAYHTVYTPGTDSEKASCANVVTGMHYVLTFSDLGRIVNSSVVYHTATVQANNVGIVGTQGQKCVEVAASCPAALNDACCGHGAAKEVTTYSATSVTNATTNVTSSVSQGVTNWTSCVCDDGFFNTAAGAPTDGNGTCNVTHFCTDAVPDASNGGANPFAAGVRGAGLEQTFTLSFVHDSMPSRNQSVALSGNPGYLHGMPLLAGNAVADGEDHGSASDGNGTTLYIARAVGGLSFASPELDTVACNNASTRNSSAFVSVLFGVDASVGCSLALKLDELKAECASGALVSNLLAGLALGGVDVVGRYGDSHPLRPSEWASLEGIAALTAEDAFKGRGTWDEESRTCLGLPNEVHWTLLYDRVGPTADPQFEVLGGSVTTFSSSSDTWAAVKPALMQAGGSGYYPVRSTVTFVRQEGRQHTKVGVKPLVLPPWKALLDLLYPFVLPNQIVQGDLGDALFQTISSAFFLCLVLILLPAFFVFCGDH